MSVYMRIKVILPLCVVMLSGCVTPPVPFTNMDNSVNAKHLRKTMGAGQTPVTAPISLYDAMARALKYNLDHRVKMMETDLAQRNYDLSKYDMLPQIVANGGYYGRNNDVGSSSLSLLSGRQSLEPSTATKRNLFNADLTASWNILDFGVSKIRAQQLGDKTLIHEERRRKAIIQLMEDVHRAYWRAVSAQRLGQRLHVLESDVQTAFRDSRKLYAAHRTAPMPALSYQRELNDITLQAQKMQGELGLAKIELAALMNLPAGTEYSLVIPQTQTAPGTIVMPFERMVETALQHRPEIRESAYAVRIGEAGVRKVVLEALPGLQLYGGLNANSNSFLVNKDWISYGAKASWNLMKIFETPMRKRKAQAEVALEKQRAMATAVAVTAQISIARARYESLWSEYQTAVQGAEVQTDILGQITAMSRARSASRQALVREQMNAILSEARRDVTHAELQEATANIYTAMGYDPYGADITGRENLQTLSKSLRVLWTARARSPSGKDPRQTRKIR